MSLSGQIGLTLNWLGHRVHHDKKQPHTVNARSRNHDYNLRKSKLRFRLAFFARQKMKRKAVITIAGLSIALISLVTIFFLDREQHPMLLGCWGNQSSNHLPLATEVALGKNSGSGDLLLLTLRMLGTTNDLLFAVDTGAPFCILDKSLESQLRQGLLKKMWINSCYGSSWESVYIAPKLHLNGVELRTSTRVATFDLTRVSKDLNEITHSNYRVMGILGMDCLQHYCVQFDFDRRKIQFLDPDHLQENELGKAFPLTLSWGQPFVEQNLLGSSEKTLIDTGCNFDGELKTAEFKRWTNHWDGFVSRGANCPNGVFDGQSYPELEIVGDANYNSLGLRFLARHLVTLNFPRRTMYLKRTNMESPGSAAHSAKEAGS